MKALILSCNTGEGHNSCAKAIQECFESHGTVCDICDTLGFISKRVSRFISGGHVFVYRHVPGLFRRSYRFSEKHEELFREGSFTYRLMASGAGRLHDFISKNGYDTVICPHVFAALMVTEMKKRYPSPIHTCYVNTDYTCTPGTIESRLDLYFMPDKSVMQGFERVFDMGRVVESGIPVRQRFYSGQDKAGAKKALGIPEDAKHLLVMCGSMGCGPMKRLCARLADQLGDKQYLTVVCGTNHPLEKWLHLRYGGRGNIRILGFTGEISLLMDSADLYLTKPGGISTSEAAVKALPMVLVDAVSGCEGHNRDYFVRSGLAVTAEEPKQLARLCVELLGDEKQLAAMRAAGLRRPRCHSAQLIYNYMGGAIKQIKEG